MNVIAQQAREHHQAAMGLGATAAQHRAQRNALVRRLRAEDSDRWSYGALAAAIGCSKELVAAIVAGRTV